MDFDEFLSPPDTAEQEFEMTSLTMTLALALRRRKRLSGTP